MTFDAHKADIAATESDDWTRKDYCRLVGKLVGNLTSTIETLGPSVVNGLAQTPGTWEITLGHLLARRTEDVDIARSLAVVLRRHAFEGVTVADEQSEYWIGYYAGYVTEADKAAGEAMFAEIFGQR